MRTRALVLVGLVAASGALLGCGWLVGVTGDVTLATDAGDDEPDGAERALIGDGSAQLPGDTGPSLDAPDDVDAESREDGEPPDRDASRWDAARDARDD